MAAEGLHAQERAGTSEGHTAFAEQEQRLASTALVLHGSEAPTDPSEGSLGIFSTRRPRDLAAGTSSALKSVTKGVLAGVAGLVAAPVIGAQNDGVAGFFTGLGVGLVGAVALPVAGAAVGVAQIARGAYNTGEAASEAALGKVWSHAKREWIFYSLREEAIEVLASPDEAGGDQANSSAQRGEGAGSGGASSRARKVAETDLYDTLGVPPAASSAEIKKAYYTLARKLHPDKNPNDPNAKAAFQRVGEAYQVLSNDELRAKYDRAGRDGIGQQTFLESSTFFAILFGSEQFDSLVGELQLASLFAMDGQVSEKQLAAKQRRREVVCALHLAQQLAMYVAGDEREFAADMHELAARLAKSSFGDVLLYTIGSVYEGKAAEYFGGGAFEILSTRYAKLRAQGHAASSAIKLAQAGVRTYTVFKQIEKSMEQTKKAGAQDAQANLALEVERTGAMALMLESAWRVSVLDIESTLSHVCDKVLQDSDVDAQGRRRRAQGLKLLGQIFCEHGMPDAELNFASQLKTAMQNMESSMLARAQAGGDVNR